MAAPTAPTQQYDFQDHSVSNPTDQQPGDKLDEEFEHHRATIANIVDFVRTQIGDDGYLKGGSVDVDQISSTVLALLNTNLNFLGAWATTTVYALSDVVQEDSRSYVCIVAHTSGTFTTDFITNSYWQIFAAPERVDASVLADRLSGDGTTGPFTLSETLGTDEGVIFVFDHNGNIMDPVVDYTLSGTSLTFSANTTVGTNNYQVRSMIHGISAAQTAAETAQALAETAQGLAETAQTAAELAETNAETIYDNFDDRYLGSFATDPTLDNDGNALVDGALYFDTALAVMKVYDLSGTAWLQMKPTASEQANIDAAVADATDIGLVAASIADVNAVALIDGNVTTVAGIASDVSSVASLATGWTFDATLTMADPGAGTVRLNNAASASVTAIAIDDIDINGANVSLYLASWDDSTSFVKGHIGIRKGGDSTVFAVYRITSLVDNVGWVELALTHVASGGTFSASDTLYVDYVRTGDAGAATVTTLGGVPDVTIAGAVTGEALVFTGTFWENVVLASGGWDSLTISADRTLDDNTHYTTGSNMIINSGVTLAVPVSSLLEQEIYANGATL
jgi:hypothetical protein